MEFVTSLHIEKITWQFLELLSYTGKNYWSHKLKHLQHSQHGFLKSRSSLTNLISFYNKVTRSVNEGKSVDVYLDFSKAFHNISHSFLLDKLAAHGVGGHTLH